MARAVKKAKTDKKPKTGAVIGYDVIKSKYKIHDVRTGSGKRRAVDNSDRVSEALRGKTEAEWAKIAKENDVVLNAKLQAGLRRLALGNSLRRIMRVNGRIKVLGSNVKA